MKAFHSIIFLCFVLIVGCAQSEILQHREEDLLSQISNHRTALEPDFQFLGKVTIAEKAGWDTRLRGASLRSESLVYGHVSKDNVIERGVIVRTYVLLGESGTLLDDLLAENTTIIDSGTMRVASRDVAYELLAEKDILELNEKRLAESKGLIVRDCYLVKDYRLKLKGFLDKSKSQILFFDSVDLGKAGLECMRSADTVPPAENALFLSEFNRKADACLKVLLEGKGSSSEKAAMESDDRAPGSGTTEIERKLSTLKKLLDQGLITLDDYEKKKAELLEGF